jgi:NTE family protein
MVYGTTTYNSFDRPFFPPQGFKMDILAGYVMGLRPNLDVYENRLRIGNVRDLGLSYGNYFRATVDAKKISTLSKKLANVTHLQAGINFGPNASLLNNFVIGGNTSVTRNQITFLGLNEGKLLTESAIALQTGVRWNAFKDAYLTIAANALHYDFVKKPSANTIPRWITGAGVTFGYNLPIGPFEYTFMYSKQAGWGTYINVGFPFK